MRVAIVVGSLHGGGAERQAAILYRGLARTYPTRMVSLESRNDYLVAREGDDVHFLHKESRTDAPRLVRQVRRLLSDVDVAVCFHWYPHLVVRLAAPHVVRIARYGNPVCRDVNGPWRIALARWCQRSAFATVGVSWGVLQDICATLGSPRYVCSAIPNAVGEPTVENSPIHVSSAPYVICPARLTEQKDQASLLRAFGRMAEVVPHRLVLAGQGPDREMLEVLALECGLEDRVDFIGFRNDLATWLANADLTVLSSRWEGFGSALIESMIVGTPVVSTDAPYGPREILERVPGGVLVPVGDPAALAQAMAGVLLGTIRAPLRGADLATAARLAWSPQATCEAYEQLLVSVEAVRGTHAMGSRGGVWRRVR